MSLHLRTIVELMENNLEETLSLDQLAAYSGRSRRQIDRLFRRSSAPRHGATTWNCASPRAAACCSTPTCQ